MSSASTSGPRIVIMGVSGCGKSTLGRAVAEDRSLPFIEGDDFHSERNRQKMADGIALSDDDRADWLRRLGRELAGHPHGAVLACSALKRSYRELLRAAAPGLGFVFMELDRQAATERVRERGARHPFPASLVESQFAALESPVGEAGVLRVDATAPLPELVEQVGRWLDGGAGR